MSTSPDLTLRHNRRPSADVCPGSRRTLRPALVLSDRDQRAAGDSEDSGKQTRGGVVRRVAANQRWTVTYLTSETRVGRQQLMRGARGGREQGLDNGGAVVDGIVSGWSVGAASGRFVFGHVTQ